MAIEDTTLVTPVGKYKGSNDLLVKTGKEVLLMRLASADDRDMFQSVLRDQMAEDRVLRSEASVTTGAVHLLADP